MSGTFQIEVESIMEAVASTVLTELRKVVQGSATSCFESASTGEDEAKKAESLEKRLAQLVALMKSLAQEAVNKICELAFEESVVLRLEVSENQSKIASFKRRLGLMGEKLQSNGAGQRPSNTHSVGVQTDCDSGKTERDGFTAVPSLTVSGTGTQSTVTTFKCFGEIFSGLPFILEEPDSAIISLCEDAVPAVLAKEPSNMEDGIESAIIEEGRDEDLKSSPPEERLHVSKTGPVEEATVAAVIPEGEHQYCVVGNCSSTTGTKRLPTQAKPRTNGAVLSGKDFRTENGAKSCKRGNVMGKALFSCLHCRKSFAELKDLEVHGAVHAVETRHRCAECGRSFTAECRLKRHMLLQAGDKRHSCSTCGAIFSNKRQLMQHWLVHARERPFCCNVCGKTFTRAYALKKHQLVHTGEKAFSCQVCGKRFAFAGNLTRHKRIHTGEKPFTCSVCGKSFNQRSTMKEHENLHSGVKQHVCMICGKSFSLKSGLKKHQQVHARARAHVCVVCLQGFSELGSLRDHQRTHASEEPCVTCGGPLASPGNHSRCLPHCKPFLCAICGKDFATASSLGVHERSHSSSVRHGCQVCGKTFAHQSSLKTHQAVHTGEKPFCCDVCGKAFSIAGNLHRHQRIHTGERPYRCLQCGKSFNQLNVLKAHKQTHTGEKPYVCDKCGKSFAHLRNLKGHKCVIG